jgi:hypothetical protein
MNDPLQHEIDDELLSAYLDDELSAEDRALVESRLAADPVARQTLEQLRSVSQSMRDLPAESLGRDLRDPILERARTVIASRSQRAAAPAPSPEPPSPSCQLPAVTFGRTIRGWVWASAAIAAAILIMVLQPSNERNANLPSVAKRAESNSETSLPVNRQLAQNQPANRAADSSATPAPAMPEARAPTASFAAPKEHAAAGQSSIAAVPSSEPAESSDGFAPDASPLLTPADAAPEMAAAPPAAEAPTAGEAAAVNQPVVVRVLARRAAVDNNAFETLLQKNGVVIEPSAYRLMSEGRVAASEPAQAGSARSRELLTDAPADDVAESELKDDRQAAAANHDGAQQSGDIELVWVDAPSKTIISCMNELNRDADNFAGISVDVPPPTVQEQAAATTAENKQASQFARFNRGTVPPSQDSLAGAELYFDYWGNEAAKHQPPRRYIAKSPDVESRDKEESLAIGGKNGTDPGRAQRLQLREAENLDASRNAAPYRGLSTTDAKHKQLWSINQLPGPATADAQRMQVLFVIRPTDEPAPSLKARNRAE